MNLQKWSLILICPILLSYQAFSQIISINKSILSFFCVENGSLPLSQRILVTNSGTGNLFWNITENIDWLDVNPTNGKDSSTFDVSITTTNKNPGVYNDYFEISSLNATNSPQRINITYTVLQRPTININVKEITFYAFQNGPLPNIDSSIITNSGSGSLIWSAVSNVNWLIVNPASGNDSSLIKLRIYTTNMNPGIYDALVTIISNEAQNSPQTINIKYILNRPYQTTFNLNQSIDFPTYSNISNYKSANYKLIGLPGNSNLTLNNFFSGEQGTDWQAFRDNGLDTNYFIEYDGSDNFKFSSGKGFWIIKRSPLLINTIVNSAPINAQQKTEIPLHSGWNIITNPFMSTIAWSKIQAINNITSPIWKFSGFFDTSQFLNPYEGYYFDNSDKLKTLVIPYGEFSKNNEIKNSYDPIMWKIKICLINNNNNFGSITLGSINDSEKQYDRHDFRKPRNINRIPLIYFDRSDWDKSFKYMAADFRPLFNESESWDFTIENLELNSINALEFNDLRNIPMNFDIYLTNLENGININLRKYTTYSFSALNNSIRFRLTIEREKNNEGYRNEYNLPGDYNISIYPNPFNQSTFLLVDTPEITEINLSIFDILGRRVSTVYRGAIIPGRYRFYWNGRNDSGVQLSSGIYIFNISIKTGLSLSRRMILLK